MDKIDNPHAVMLERLHRLERSIHVLNLVNNDLRLILHKQKPLPQFVRDSIKRSTMSKPKTSSAPPAARPPPPPPTDTEEMRLAASVIDKARRTIENVGEKKPKQPPAVIATTQAVNPPNATHSSRPKTTSSSRPASSASSTTPTLPNPPAPQPTGRRYVPAHVKAPFLTQPEKKRRSSSSVRNSIQTNSEQRPGTARRSGSQQRRTSITTQPAAEPAQPVPTPAVQMNNPIINGAKQATVLPDQTPESLTIADEPIAVVDGVIDTDEPLMAQPVILNRALIKPLRRLAKQNHQLRARLKHEMESKVSPPPLFIDRLNEQISSSRTSEDVRVPNVEVVLQLAAKLRAIVLHLLETATFNDLQKALNRLHTLKNLVTQYQFFFATNTNILVAISSRQRPPNANIKSGEWLNKHQPSRSTAKMIRYSDDSQLIAFTEVRFKQFENECRWIELNWHEQMILQFKQATAHSNSNPLQIYRELMSLVTGLQASTPIVVENRVD